MSSTLKYVDHTYRDFSRYVEDGGELIKHKKSGNNFPARLHQILSEPLYANIITWMPHGRAWRLLDKDRLISEVIPSFYVCKKYESFTRQLNGWGFKRLHQHGPDFGCYYHECFLRDIPAITCLIRRLAPNRGKATPFAEGEPNFYKIGEVYPLPPPPRSASQAKDRRGKCAVGPESSLALAALSLARADISSAAMSTGIYGNIQQPSSLTAMSAAQGIPGLPRKVSTQEASVLASSQAGSYYHPSNKPSLLGGYTPSQYSGHYYGTSYDRYPIQNQQYPQQQYYRAEPAQLSRQLHPVKAPNEDGQKSDAHASPNENGRSGAPPMPSRKVSIQSQPDIKRSSERSSEQDNGTDPFEPIPLS